MLQRGGSSSSSPPDAHLHLLVQQQLRRGLGVRRRRALLRGDLLGCAHGAGRPDDGVALQAALDRVGRTLADGVGVAREVERHRPTAHAAAEADADAPVHVPRRQQAGRHAVVVAERVALPRAVGPGGGRCGLVGEAGAVGLGARDVAAGRRDKVRHRVAVVDVEGPARQVRDVGEIDAAPAASGDHEGGRRRAGARADCGGHRRR